MNADPDSALIEDLLLIEAHSARKKRLARVLRRVIRSRSPVGAEAVDTAGNGADAGPGWPNLEKLWVEVAALDQALLQLDRDRLRRLCRRETGGGSEAPFLTGLLFGESGVLARAEREAAFLEAWRPADVRSDRARMIELAERAPRFEADLLAGVGQLRRAVRELRALGRSPLEVHALGFGEMSRPVTLSRRVSLLAPPGVERPIVYKRMAPFATRRMAEQYVRVYEEYNRRLRDDVGLSVPSCASQMLADQRRRTVVYCLQGRLDPRALGKNLLRRRQPDQCRVLFHMVLDEYRKLIRFNQRPDGFRMGLDGQIPNWVVRDYRGDDAPLRGDEGLWFIDTNTPMMRRYGVECLPMSFYLRGMPWLIRPFVRPLAKQVLDRYFDPRIILLDFLANVEIHGRPDLVELFLPDANGFLAEGLIQPAPRLYTRAEVDQYVRKDIGTWRLLRSVREIEAMLEGRQGPRAAVRKIRDILRRPLFE